MALASFGHSLGTGDAHGAGAPGGAAARTGRRRWVPYVLLAPGMLWLTVFFLAPVATLFLTATQSRVSGLDGVFVQTWSFSNYPDALSRYGEQFARSFLYAGVATVAALLIGYPLAYLIAFKAGRWRNVLLVLVVAPFFCSFVLRTLAWKQILADEGPVTQTARALHLIGAQTSLNVGAFAVVCGLTYTFLPFMTLPLYSSLERIDPHLLEAGADLYGDGFTVLRKVTVPLSLPGIVSGTLLTFIPATGDYVNANLLGNTQTRMIGNVIESRFFQVVDYPTAAALSFLLMAAILLLVTLYLSRTPSEELV